MITLEMAYEKHCAGSEAFCRSIEKSGDVQLTRAEMKRIAGVAPNASAFMLIWGEHDWWQD